MSEDAIVIPQLTAEQKIQILTLQRNFNVAVARAKALEVEAQQAMSKLIDVRNSIVMSYGADPTKFGFNDDTLEFVVKQ